MKIRVLQKDKLGRLRQVEGVVGPRIVGIEAGSAPSRAR